MPKLVKSDQSDNLPAKRDETETIPVIFEPRCKVCTSSMRNEIELLIANGYNMNSIANKLQEAGQDISYRSVSRHRDNHMSMKHSAFRMIMEKQAKELGELNAEGAIRIVSGKAWLDIFVQQATELLVAGEMEIEARDVVKAIELRDALEKEGFPIFKQEIMVELRAIIEAMKEIAGAELALEISKRARELAQDMRHAELEANVEDATYEEIPNVNN